MALSEVVGTLLSITITIIAGAAVWGYVRTQAGTSELSYANNVAATNNYLNEQFKIVDMNFPAASSCPGATTTGCITFWVYNTGSVAFSPFSVRFYDSAGLINLMYNYTVSGTTKTDQVYDLLSTLSTKCILAASSYETNAISVTSVQITNMQYITLTIPPAQAGCSSDPSYGQTLSTGTTYSVTVTGLYGNSVTSFQTK